MERRLIISNMTNPYYNLALEEYLIERGQACLYLWQNNKTIVIGRNQNPYRECNIERIRADGINLVRRRSGGGAVYHDLGNLNFTIISKLGEDNIQENFKLVNRALARLGIKSEFNGRNDILVGTRKISGNAFYEDGDIFCQHGTLLIDLDIDRLGNYLTVSKLKLESKGIKSVKSRVSNLKDLDQSISVARVKEALIAEYGGQELEPIYYKRQDLEGQPRLMDKVRKYGSWDWVYGESPESNMGLEKKYDWGIINFDFLLGAGKILRASIDTDSIIEDNFQALARGLEGLDFRSENIVETIERYIGNPAIRQDLVNEFKNI